MSTRHQSRMSALDYCEESARRYCELSETDPVLKLFGRALLDLICDAQYATENPAAHPRVRPDAVDYVSAAYREWDAV
jgi:hypothetical protein